MIIGINAAAIPKQPKTGVEEYVYQLIKHLAELRESGKHRFLLYTPSRRGFDFFLPDNFVIKELKWSWPMWTQVRLAGELFLHQPDALFIPAHVLPLTHSQNSIVAIQGLEYERFPKCYPKKQFLYLRQATRYAAKNASKILVPSESTKRDLIEFYKTNPEKIKVVYYGAEGEKSKFCHSRLRGNPAKTMVSGFPARNASQGEAGGRIKCGMTEIRDKYILYIGRIETKKNLINLIKAFDLLKEKYKIPHRLVLVGAPGYGYGQIKIQIAHSKFGSDIVETGYVAGEKKWQLLGGADLFAFVSRYEGFGFPILEAQSAGCPVVCSNISSMPEVAGRGAVLVDPDDIEQIAKSMYKLIEDKNLRRRVINRGYENVKKFSWENCAKETLEFLTK